MRNDYIPVIKACDRENEFTSVIKWLYDVQIFSFVQVTHVFLLSQCHRRVVIMLTFWYTCGGENHRCNFASKVNVNVS